MQAETDLVFNLVETEFQKLSLQKQKELLQLLINKLGVMPEKAAPSTTAVLLRVFRCFAVGQVCNLPQACSGGNAAGYKPALRAGAT
jgi:hypothetical protein